MSKKKKNNVQLPTEKTETADKKSLKIPELGHQLTIRPYPAPAGNDIDDWVRIASTPTQRLRRFLGAFAAGFVLALGALCILYLPDFAFDYAHRDESFLNFFGSFLLLTLGFIGFAAAINTLIRDTVIYVSAKAKCIVAARRLTLKNINSAIRIKDMEIVYIPPEGFFKKAQITIKRQGEWLTLAESQGDDVEDINALKIWLQQLKT